MSLSLDTVIQEEEDRAQRLLLFDAMTLWKQYQFDVAQRLLLFDAMMLWKQYQFDAM